MNKLRVVLDTNLLVSYFLTPKSSTAIVVRRVLDTCQVLVSQATMDEIVRVLNRLSQKGYFEAERVSQFIIEYRNIAEWILIIEYVQECRDPKDDKFLDLAVNGKADYIITGDKDLLVLNPFRNINITSPTNFWR